MSSLKTQTHRGGPKNQIAAREVEKNCGPHRYIRDYGVDVFVLVFFVLARKNGAGFPGWPPWAKPKCFRADFNPQKKKKTAWPAGDSWDTFLISRSPKPPKNRRVNPRPMA